MSYILHAWEHPSSLPWPKSIAEVTDFLGSAQHINVGPNQKFIEFARALREVYPDLTTLEEDELDQCVWVDSPLLGNTESAIFAIGVLSDRLDGDLLQFIFHTAADHGLHLFDMQGGTHYRPNRTCLKANGRIDAAPERRAPAKSRKPSEHLTPKPSDLLPPLTERFLHDFSTSGWQLDRVRAKDNTLCVWRQNGGVRLRIRFTFSEHERGLSVFVAIGFFAPEIVDTLLKISPEEGKLFDGWRKYQGATYSDLSIQLPYLFDSVDLPEFDLCEDVGHCNSILATFKSNQEFKLWVDSFCVWFTRFGSARLNAVESISALSQLLDSDWHRKAVLYRESWFAPWFNMLAVAHIAKSPMLANWIANVRERGLGGTDKEYWRRLSDLADWLEMQH